MSKDKGKMAVEGESGDEERKGLFTATELAARLAQRINAQVNNGDLHEYERYGADTNDIEWPFLSDHLITGQIFRLKDMSDKPSVPLSFGTWNVCNHAYAPYIKNQGLEDTWFGSHVLEANNNTWREGAIARMAHDAMLSHYDAMALQEVSPTLLTQLRTLLKDTQFEMVVVAKPESKRAHRDFGVLLYDNMSLTPCGPLRQQSYYTSKAPADNYIAHQLFQVKDRPSWQFELAWTHARFDHTMQFFSNVGVPSPYHPNTRNHVFFMGDLNTITLPPSTELAGRANVALPDQVPTDERWNILFGETCALPFTAIQTKGNRFTPRFHGDFLDFVGVMVPVGDTTGAPFMTPFTVVKASDYTPTMDAQRMNHF